MKFSTLCLLPVYLGPGGAGGIIVERLPSVLPTFHLHQSSHKQCVEKLQLLSLSGSSYSQHIGGRRRSHLLITRIRT